MVNKLPIGNKVDQSISVYVHLPFCTKKCAYCHFFVLPDKEGLKQQLIASLKQEWQLVFPSIENRIISTLYFGGGTPSLVSPDHIAGLIQLISPTSGAEITLEANPENISTEKMKAYTRAGVNRVSIGIQTLNDQLLYLIGREHTSAKALASIYKTKDAGIDNISIDLMYDLPHQHLEHWESTLEEVSQLPITHLSLYNMTIEPHTIFFKQRHAIEKAMPSEEISLQMYEMAVAKLEKHGLKQYEISAFQRKDSFSRHNTGYWTGRQFLGLGPSAFSYWLGKRYQNVANLNQYSKSLNEGILPLAFTEELDLNAKKRELLAIQLRLKEGVNLKFFQISHGELELATKITLEQLAEDGLLEITNETVSLTKKGILFYDTVAAELV